MPSISGAILRSTALSGSPAPPGCGSRRVTVLKSKPPYLTVQIGSAPGMRSSGFFGKIAASSRRTDSVNARFPQIESANRMPPRSMYVFI